jgi:hypothetical protein
VFSLIFKLFGFLLNRKTIFILIGLVAIAWLVKGYSASRDFVSRQTSVNSDYLAKTLKQLQLTDPEAAAKMAVFMEGRSQNALVAAIKAEEKQYGSSAVREMAQRLKNESGPYLPWFELTAMATNPELVSGQENIEKFLNGNTVVYDIFYETGSFQLAEWYRDMLLEAGKNSGQYWQIIQDNPVAILVWTALGQSHPDLWEYFVTESEWLSETLLFAAPDDLPETADPEQRLAWIAEAVAGFKKFHPLGRDIYNETSAETVNMSQEELEDTFSDTAMLTAGLLKYGDIVYYCSVKNSLPAIDVLELLILNPDMFEPPDDLSQRDDWALKQAVRLIDIQKNRPNVWAAAHMKPLVLNLDSVVPHLSDSLVRDYGADDIEVFLFRIFEEGSLANAAEAVSKFGDLAIYIFQKYETNPDLNQILRLHGPRIVPFLAVYENNSFAKLNSEDGRKWLDKYFDEKGNERDQGWISALPIIGGPAQVLKNWASGYPSTWGELGWAALDVADGALLIASFGVSAPVTAGKQAAKTGVKTTVRTVVKKGGGRRLLGTATRSERSLVKQDFQKALTSYGSKAGKRVRSPLFTTLAKSKSLAVTSRAVVWRTVSSVIKVPAKAVWKTLVTVKRTWTAMPPMVRQTILRAMSAVGILYTLTERSFPIAAEKITKFFETLPKHAEQGFQTITKSLNDSVMEVLKGAVPSTTMSPVVMYVAVFLVFALILYFIRPKGSGIKRA